MWEQILDTAAGAGLWALLFVALFFFQIKDSKTRETKYQDIISALAEKFNIVSDMKETLEEIAEKVFPPQDNKNT